MNCPLVSVLVSNYNYRRFLREAVDSVFSQTYSNYEVILCDDGSTDGSIELIEEMRDINPTLQVVFQKNQGQGAALTAAYEVSEGSILCLLDADDLFAPDKLTDLVETFKLYPDIGLIGHRLIRIDARGKPIGMLPSKETMPQGRLSDEIFRQNSVAGMPTTSGLAITREIAEVAFPIGPAINRDVDEVIRRVALSVAPMRSIEYPLGMYRTHETNYSGSALDLLRIDATIDLYRSINYHHRECLMRLDSRLADRVVPVHADPDLTTLELVRARLYGQDSREIKARVRNAIRDGRIREGRKFFWWIMSIVPMPLFRFGLSLLNAQGGAKVRIANALRPLKKLFATQRS